MEYPEPEVMGGILTYDWEKEYGLVVVVDRIQDTGRAELKFYAANGNNYRDTILHARSDLLSTSNMETLRRRLERSDSKKLVDWDTLLTYISAKTMKVVRQGEEVAEIVGGNEMSKPEWVLYPFIIKNLPSCILGSPSAMKSTFAQVLSQVVALPLESGSKDWFGILNLSPPAEPVNVLYLDWELDRGTFDFQLRKLGNGMDICPVCYYRRCWQPLCNDLDSIRYFVDKYEIELIIIDSLSKAAGGAGGSLKDDDTAIKFGAALRSLNITSLTLAHDQKPNENIKTKSIYGSQFFTADFRNVWECTKYQEPGSNHADIVLTHRKPAPFMSLCKPVGYRFDFPDDDSFTIETGNTDTIPELIDRLTTSDKIRRLLSDGVMRTARQISEEINATLTNTRQTLGRLQDKGIIIRIGELYGLKDKHEENELF